MGTGRVRALWHAVVILVLAIGPVSAQSTDGGESVETRPALSTVDGDTGIWVVPTAETLPKGKIAASLFRANGDRKQGLTDVSNVGLTAAVGVTERLELFGSWGLVRLDRDVRPIYVPTDDTFGGVANEFPFIRTGWSKNLGAPLNVGAKWNLLSQSRQDGLALAPRVVLSFPTGPTYGATDAFSGTIGLVASGEFSDSLELTGTLGAVLRADPDAYDVSNGMKWGVGASFPSRSPVRALIEAWGETALSDDVRVTGSPVVASDGSVQPLVSGTPAVTGVKVGGVWQATPGFYLHGGVNFTPGVSGRTVGGRLIDHNGWGADISIGWHPGTRRYFVPVPPQAPPPPPLAAAPTPRNQNPTVTAACNPCTVEVGETSTIAAMGSDPDGDMLVFRWTAPLGSFGNRAAPMTVWTAPNQPGTVTLTVTVEDGRGGSASSTVDIVVQQTMTFEFDPVYFDFDRSNLRPDAVETLDEAVATLTANPDLRVTIEGHTDSVGTLEYNLALGDRRAGSVRDYLVDRGIEADRMETVSFGEERPESTNDTAEGRQLNRRAEIVVIIQ